MNSTMTTRFVTPFAGVWIEINVLQVQPIFQRVTPFAGVWIEINLRRFDLLSAWSLPSRECGLK